MIVSLNTRIAPAKQIITFNKAELSAILSVYSFQVAKGNWRDYAIDFLKQMAAFSIFRHSAEQPVVTVTKIPGNTASGFIYEVFIDKKRIARTADLEDALQSLKDKIS